ncbi:MAG: hypothetical protein WBL29_02360 [Burkholderiales bacterium]
MPVKGNARFRLARFLHVSGMSLFTATFRSLPLEDRVNRLSRWALVFLLLATLACLI